jgi:SWI/SNF-related matrix-associated actin-dependent regulator of chromatin subfamily A3
MDNEVQQLMEAPGSLFAEHLKHEEFPLYHVKANLYKTEQTQIQKQGVSFMCHREENATHRQYGGIIADELGCGKTFQTLTTIVEQLMRHRQLYNDSQKTLIVGPANVVYEWRKQIEKHVVDGVLKVHFYHGSGRVYKPPEEYDIILTSYGVVAKEYNQYVMLRGNGTRTHWIGPGDGQSPFSELFDRIVLDEAHNIRNVDTKTHKAVCELNGEKKWCITGTPIWNHVKDIYAIFKFLDAAPYREWEVFQTSIIHRLYSQPQLAMNVLSSFLLSIEIRRTKRQLNLPPLTERTVCVELNENERLFYDAFYNYSRDTVKRLFQNEKWLKKTGYAKAITNLQRRAKQCIMTIILRLRQTCTHPQMAIDAYNKYENDPIMDSELLGDPRILEAAAGRLMQLVAAREEAQVQGRSTEECAICLTNTPDQALIPCAHTFCGDCLAIMQAQDAHSVCPFCRSFIADRQPIERALAMIIQEENGEDQEDEVEMIRQWDPYSSKIGYMMTQIREKMQRDATTKVLIFSQWHGSLDKICEALQRDGLKYMRIDGTVSMKKRAKFQDDFNSDPSIQVMVCSLNCSSEGINLQGANVVYILDLWWTLSRAKQAGNRSHRVGQTRPVELFHLIANNTIEERILEMQQRKQKVIDATNGRHQLQLGWEGEIRRLLDLD